MIIGVILDSENNLLIVTELCEQESIKKFMSKFKKKAPLNVKLRILFDIAKAIYYMHENEPTIIHRDLKPENIFLTADLKAKIGDFGYKNHLFNNLFRIAKLNEMTEFSNVNTETIATLQYMPPEAMKKSQYSKSSDIYSFGVVAYEIIFEKTAFGGLEGFNLIDAVVNKKENPEIPSDFEHEEVIKMLKSCWSYEPEDRPNANNLCKIVMKILKRLKKKN